MNVNNKLEYLMKVFVVYFMLFSFPTVINNNMDTAVTIINLEQLIYSTQNVTSIA
jgi:hypothetical protein